MKHLIVCCDGTWNRADQVVDGVVSPTNVWKLKSALADEDHEGNTQLVHYLEGVGTRRWERITGGGLGVGLSRNVQAAYRFLFENYEPGDELYLFGFSRGAFTARSTAGLVRNAGILRPEHLGRCEDAYKLYRSGDPAKRPSGEAAKAFRQAYSYPDVRIKLIGVWDTVGALGIPIDGFRPPFLSRLWTFHDATLSSAVDNAFHAVSIDERRGPFKPTLWVEDEKDGGGLAKSTPEQTVEQVWFAGVHSDVGGGYPDPSLSEIPLRWMAAKAADCGLAFKPDRLVHKARDCDAGRRCLGIEVAPNLRADLHDSRKGMYRLMPAYDRGLRAPKGEAVGPWLASSAGTRYDEDAAYRSPGLEAWVTGKRPVTQVPDGREITV